MLIGQVSRTWHIDWMRLFWFAGNIQVLSNYFITAKKKDFCKFALKCTYVQSRAATSVKTANTAVMPRFCSIEYGGSSAGSSSGMAVLHDQKLWWWPCIRLNKTEKPFSQKGQAA